VMIRPEIHEMAGKLGAEALGFGGPESELVFDGREALGFGGPESELVFDGRLHFCLL
jgi:hypothetical protein